MVLVRALRVLRMNQKRGSRGSHSMHVLSNTLDMDSEKVACKQKPHDDAWMLVYS